MKKTKILKILPLSNLTRKELAKAMCDLGYCFLENISKKYYDECGGIFTELWVDIEWIDEEEAFDLFLGVSTAYDIDNKLLPDYYGLWVKKDYAEENFNLGYISDYCFEETKEKMPQIIDRCTLCGKILKTYPEEACEGGECIGEYEFNNDSTLSFYFCKECRNMLDEKGKKHNG